MEKGWWKVVKINGWIMIFLGACYFVLYIQSWDWCGMTSDYRLEHCFDEEYLILGIIFLIIGVVIRWKSNQKLKNYL